MVVGISQAGRQTTVNITKNLNNMFTFLKILVGLAVLAFLVGTVRMWQVEHSTKQKTKGDAPLLI
jgi:hypothetical protein